MNCLRLPVDFLPVSSKKMSLQRLLMGSEGRERESETEREGQVPNSSSNFSDLQTERDPSMGEKIDGSLGIERISQHHPHPLTLIEKSKEEGIRCDGCLSLISDGSGFGCGSCRFFLHDHCTKLPLELPHHPLHPDGLLQLHLVELKFGGQIRSSWCKLCSHYIVEGFVYKCNGMCCAADFAMHWKCAVTEPSIVFPNHKHPLYPVKEFYCRGANCFLCGLELEYRKDGINLYRCLQCAIRIHESCFLRFPSKLEHSGIHPHTLELYSDPLSEEIQGYGTSCNICDQRRGAGQAFYGCKECHFVCHVRCGNSGPLLPQVEDRHELDSGNGNLKHCFHYCVLDCCESEVYKGARCVGCQSQIDDEDAFGCRACGFFLHQQCAKMPQTLQHMLHPKSPITLERIGDLYSPPTTDDYLCKVCYLPIHKRFFYECKQRDCEFCSENGRLRIHMDCAALTPSFKHPGHKHMLAFIKEGACSRICTACGVNILSNGAGFYSCLNCSFRLHKECFNLPEQDERTDDRRHPLTIHYHPLPEDYDEDDYYCDWCNERRDVHTFSYTCRECDYVCHIRCDIFDKSPSQIQHHEKSKGDSALEFEPLQESPAQRKSSQHFEMDTDNALLTVKPSTLKFIYELNKKISCFLLLENKSTNRVAFKVKVTKLEKYTVKPNDGFILPRKKCQLTVTMKEQQSEPPNLECKDKFMVQSVVVPLGSIEEHVTNKMFQKNAGHFVEEIILRVAYIHPYRWRHSAAGSTSSQDEEEEEEEEDDDEEEEEEEEDEEEEEGGDDNEEEEEEEDDDDDEDEDKNDDDEEEDED